LHALAEALRETTQGTMAITPSDVSKAQRGMLLWAQASHP
jgi:hypothetical protein